MTIKEKEENIDLNLRWVDFRDTSILVAQSFDSHRACAFSTSDDLVAVWRSPGEDLVGCNELR